MEIRNLNNNLTSISQALHNEIVPAFSIARDEKSRVITSIALGAILLSGGLFLLLAALKVLPHGMNAICQLGIVGKLVGEFIIGLGILSTVYGLTCWYRSKKTSSTTNKVYKDNQILEKPRQADLIKPHNVKHVLILQTKDNQIVEEQPANEATSASTHSVNSQVTQNSNATQSTISESEQATPIISSDVHDVLILQANDDLVVEEQPESSATFAFMPANEILMAIFQYLRPNQLCAVSRVCKQWQHISSDNAIWKRHYESEFGIQNIDNQYKTEYAKQKLNRVFNGLLQHYHAVVRDSSKPAYISYIGVRPGIGFAKKGQLNVNTDWKVTAAWNKLDQFARRYPEFRTRVPQKKY